MKRFIRFFAFVGGIGAVGWLIRHRFVGMTLNREPQTPEPAPEPASDAPPSTDLVHALGVPAEDAARLRSVGITTVTQLAIADAKDLAEKTGLDEGQLTLWMEQAAALV
ncbi:MAG: hypothetical protein OXF41_13930 [bacterium]|nr:hypothetical protein [bacterium]